MNLSEYASILKADVSTTIILTIILRFVGCKDVKWKYLKYNKLSLSLTITTSFGKILTVFKNSLCYYYWHYDSNLHEMIASV